MGSAQPGLVHINLMDLQAMTCLIPDLFLAYLGRSVMQRDTGVGDCDRPVTTLASSALLAAHVVHCTLSLYTVNCCCTLYVVYYTLCTVYYSLYTVYYSLYTVDTAC